MSELGREPAIPKNFDVDSKPKSAWAFAWHTGFKAAKRNRIPGVVMWLFGIALVGSYFYVPSVQELLDAVGRFKTELGWKFSLVSTAIFGGFIPAMVARMAQSESSKVTWGFVGANSLLWAYKGVEIDGFYQFQAWLFGASASFSTIVTKTICDQLIMVPLFGIVNVVLFYVWRDCGYSFRRFRSALGKNWYRRRVLPVLIANWVVWIPAVAMIYSLPTSLQLPVQNLVLCFWVLILLFFTHRPEQ